MGNCEQMASIVIFLDSLILDQGTTPEEKKNCGIAGCFLLSAIFFTLPKPVINAPKLVSLQPNFCLIRFKSYLALPKPSLALPKLQPMSLPPTYLRHT